MVEISRLKNSLWAGQRWGVGGSLRLIYTLGSYEPERSMPKSNVPTETPHPEKVDDNVVSIRISGQRPLPPTSADGTSDTDPIDESTGRSRSHVDATSVSDESSNSICPETSERWATAILSLMHVERSRFQEQPENIPRVHIASLAAIGRPRVTTTTGSAHSSITLRKPRSAQTDPAQEASKIHPFQGLKRPKS